MHLIKMRSHEHDSGHEAAETAILVEIREAEKKADGILEKARQQKETMLHEARANSSKLIADKESEARRLQEKKLMDFRENSKLITEEKLAEGKIAAKQSKVKSEKNIAKAVDFVIAKFEEMANA